MLKCPTSPRDTWPGHFIRHGAPSSLKASFDSKAYGLLQFFPFFMIFFLEM
jgi:hypothetical protein